MSRASSCSVLGLDDARLSKRSAFHPAGVATAESNTLNPTSTSSARTRIHATDLSAKERDAKEAGHRRAKEEHISSTNYGTTTQRTCISSACGPSAHHYNEDKLLRYELQGMPHRGIPFSEFIDVQFPNREKIDELFNDMTVVEEHRARFLQVALMETDERRMYEPFVALVNSILGLVDGSEMACIDRHRFPPGGAVKNADRRPDGVFVHKRADGSLPPPRRKGSTPPKDDLRWDEVLIPVEIKRDATTLLSDSRFQSPPVKLSYNDLQESLKNIQSRISLNCREQLASYALESLSANVLKRFTVGMLVVNDMVELWHFDRAGPLGTSVLKLGDDNDFEVFIDAVAAIGSASSLDLGFDPCFFHDSPWPHYPTDCLVKIPSDDPSGNAGPFVARISSNHPFDQHRCLSGRGTRILPVTLTGDPSSHIYVAKLAWQPSSRTAEAELYRRAGDIQGLPKIVFSGELGTLSHGVRGRLEDLLPFQESLPGDRVLRAIVMEKRFSPVWGLRMDGKPRKDRKVLLAQPDKLLKMMRSWVSIHRALYERGILHRDINPGNIMWQEGKIDPQKIAAKALLVDLDFSSGPDDDRGYVPDEVPFTFSTPFLALDLLESCDKPQPHLYRHDLESFFWTFLWLTLSFANVECNGRSASSWQIGSKKMIYNSKRSFLLDNGHDDFFSELTKAKPSNDRLVNSLRRLSSMFEAGHKALVSGADRGTAGNYITYENFMIALEG